MTETEYKNAKNLLIEQTKILSSVNWKEFIDIIEKTHATINLIGILADVSLNKEEECEKLQIIWNMARKTQELISIYNSLKLYLEEEKK